MSAERLRSRPEFSFRQCCVAALLISLLASFAANAPAAEAELRALESAIAGIETEQLKEHVDTLAADAFEGREAGSRGGQAGTTYVMKKLEAMKLAGGGDGGGYFQSFDSYRNVLAILPGSDEKLRDEVVILGAHLDHVGYGNRSNSYGPAGHIHNGADDNASGTAALLEVAEAFSVLPHSPRRTVLFAFWDAEEKGLLGSEHWAKHPTVPLARVKCNINADMVGRMQGEKLIVYGTRTAPGLRRLTSEANADANLELSFVWWINPRSDHYTFFQRKIPVLLLHTGLHDDYHRPSDDAHKVNVEGIRRSSQLMFRLAYDLAQRDDVPAFRAQSQNESTAQRRAYESAPPALPPRLGVSWSADDEEVQENGLKLSAVTRGSPAEKAGVRTGDRVLQIGDEAIKTGQQLRELIATTSGEVEVQIARAGSEKTLNLKATLPPVPPRLGVWWRESDAEPGAIMVAHVVPGSPAAKAGVQRLDRIYAVGGEPLAKKDDFQRLATTLTAPFDMLVERNGRMMTVVVGE